MYNIETMPDKHRVVIVFGVSHDYDYIQFAAELKEAALSVRSPERHFDLLVDFTTAQVLPQKNAAQSERNIAWCLEHGMRKSANIVPTITQRMQVQRVSGRNEALQYFSNRVEAEKWLDES